MIYLQIYLLKIIVNLMSGLISKYLHLLHISFVTGILIGHSAVIWGVLFNSIIISSPFHQAV